MSVSPDQRHKRRSPCLICGGGDDDKRGKEKRCSGFISADGDYEHCSREELAGPLDQEAGGTYAHRMHGPCRCGTQHGEARSDARKREILATYDYTAANGVQLFQVVRFAPKEFRQRRPNGAGGWIWQLGDTQRVPYRLPELLASTDQVVYVVEGEKDVDALRGIGLTATCNPGGAGKWSSVAEIAAKALTGREVVVVADADSPGRLHASAVARALHGHAKSVRVVECPTPHKDVAAMLEAGLPLVFAEPAEAPPPDVNALAPELPFAEIWTAEPEANLVIPALGIAPGPPHLVTGSWYTGKTLLLATMGLAVASGKDLFGIYGVKRGKWIHFDHEMGRRHLKRYVQRLRKGMKIDIEELEGNMSLRVLPALNLARPDALDHYTRILEGYDLATIDPLRAATPGMDENKSEFRQHIDLLAIAGDRAGCSVVLLHHGGKPVEGAERRNTGRGTSAIDDAVQSKFVLTAKEKGAPMLVTHEKSRELTNVVADFYLEIDNSDPDAVVLIHRDMEEMAGRLEAIDKSRGAVGISKAIQAITAFFVRMGGAFTGSRADIGTVVGGKKQAFDAAWITMRNNGAIKSEGPYHRPTWTLGTNPSPSV